jgi:hypothetical protein
MSRLTSVHGSFPAHVIAARLTAEGFDVELRGAVDSPYAVTIGDLALVHVYVPEEQVEDASYVLLVTEVDAVLEEDLPRTRRQPPYMRVVAAALIAMAVLSVLSAVHYAF